MRRNVRSPNRSTGANGAGRPRSRRMRATRQRQAATSSAAPLTGASISRPAPKKNIANTAADAAALTASTPRPVPATAGSARAATSASAPIGRLTANSQGQLAADRINAPTDGPAAPASATATAFQPIACASRSVGTVKRSSIAVIAMIAPPPMPCAKRATTSIGRLVATAHAAEAAMKTAAPPTNTRLGPKLSPSAANGNSEITTAS